jgi:hypothetical protein
VELDARFGVRLAAAVALAALAAVLGASGPAEAETEEPSSPKPLLPPSAIGIAPQATLDAHDYEGLAEAGVGIVRAPLNWPSLQAEPGDCKPEPAVDVCNWAAMDELVGNAALSGARVLPVVAGVPEFVSEHASEPPLGGEALRGWRDFLRAAVRRYGPGGAFWTNEFVRAPFKGEPQPITEWQVWNEPNGKVHFHPRPSARRYGKLLKVTSEALRGVDPEAEIVLGGMFGSARIPQPIFLRRLYRVRAIKRHFDAIALHPYAVKIRGLDRQVRRARREARRARDRKVGLWVTELGWGSGKGGHRLEIGPQRQAARIVNAFDLLGRQRERWNVEGVILFTWQDRRDGLVCRFCRHAGLFDAVDRSKPAWEAFKQVTGASAADESASEDEEP